MRSDDKMSEPNPLREAIKEIIKHARYNAVYFGFGWAEDK